MPKSNIIPGDCREVMRGMAENSVDSIVTDPPYELGFMGKTWDRSGIAYDVALWQEALRLLKPGGHLLAFGGSRTYHRLACAIEDAGFEIRDQIMWVYGSGFPKSLDVSKAIDKSRKEDKAPIREIGRWLKERREERGLKQKEVAAHWPSETNGITGCVANWELGFNLPKWDQWIKLKELIGFGSEMDEEVWRLNERKGKPGENWNVIDERIARAATGSIYGTYAQRIEVNNPTDAAREWHGWGTALKPAHEPIVLARKPLVGNVASNVVQFGTGALNIDACRVPSDPVKCSGHGFRTGKYAGQIGRGDTTMDGEPWVMPDTGRWPANLIHDGSDEVEAAFAAFGHVKGQQGAITGQEPSAKTHNVYGGFNGRRAFQPRSDTGTASRFYYAAKASKADRNDGLNGERSAHPTVKPTELMRYLCRLITPPGGTVLDPFAGSGSTGRGAILEGFDFVGIEVSAEYAEIAEKRIAASEQSLAR